MFVLQFTQLRPRESNAPLRGRTSLDVVTMEIPNIWSQQDKGSTDILAQHTQHHLLFVRLVLGQWCFGCSCRVEKNFIRTI